MAYRRPMGWVSVAGLLVMIFFPLVACSGTEVCGNPATSHVTILRGEETVATFSVAVAESVEQRRRGLMKCPRLEPGTGMLFAYGEASPHTIWMKDTMIELAIVFIGPDSRISAIKKGVPNSLTHTASPGPVRSILEINFLEAQGLRIGDRVSHITSQSN